MCTYLIFWTVKISDEIERQRETDLRGKERKNDKECVSGYV